MREKILKVGQVTPLHGIITCPKKSHSEVCVLILNSGLMHHVGTSRISVMLARKLAENGVLSVRFDFSGIGDSLPRRTKTNSVMNTQLETIEVMDEIQSSYGVKSFVLYGLCSGADVSFAVAQKDDRVAGIAQIDPYLYRNHGWFLRHYGPRLLDLKSWLGVFRRFIGKRQDGESIPDHLVETLDGNGREIPPQQDVERGYQIITSKNCKVLVIVTGGQAYTFNHRKQFRNIFPNVPWQDNLEFHYLSEAEHVIPEPEYQKEVVTIIDKWVTKIG
jgi:hypothetical protein